MGQAQPLYNTDNYVKICTLCHKEQSPIAPHCAWCRKKALTGFGFAALFLLIALGQGSLQLGETFVNLLFLLAVVSFCTGIYYCRSRVTVGAIKGNFVQFYE